MRRVPLLTIKAFDKENLPVANKIFRGLGNSINDISYGSMYQFNSGYTVVLSAIDTPTEVRGMSAISCSGFTFQNGGELQCNNDGTYSVSWSLSFIDTSAQDSIEGTIGINGTSQFWGSAHTTAPPSSREASMGGTAFISLNRGDIVALLAANHTATNNITIEHASFTILKIDD